MPMTTEKLTEVLDRYEATHVDDVESSHILTMIPKMRIFLEEGNREKLMRWLGFVQGVLWSRGDYTLEELKNHNRPDEVTE